MLTLTPPTRSFVTLLGLLALCMLAVLAAPYHFAEVNNGRYLTVALQQIDARLFQNDQVVAAMSLLFSAYYTGLGKLLRSPEQLFLVAPVLAGLCKAFAVLVCWWIGQALEENRWLAWLLAGWAVHDKTPYYGAVSLFMPTVSHHEWGIVGALIATGLLLREKPLAAYGVLGFTVFVHLLAALHFGLCLLPLLWWHVRKPGRKDEWRVSLAALTIFGLCVLWFAVKLAPPPMSAAEAAIFFQAEGSSRHFNPFARYGALRPVLLGNLLLLTFASAAYWRNELGKLKPLCDALLAGIALGTLAALAGSWLAMRGVIALALFQPLRIFLPVAFFCFVLLWLLALKAFRTGAETRWFGVCVIANLLMLALEQNWGLLFTLPVLLGVATRQLRLAKATIQPSLKALTAVLLAALAFSCLAGAYQPFSSLRSPQFIVPGLAGLLALYATQEMQRWLTVSAVVIFIYVLALVTTEKRRTYAQASDADWIAVRQWCREHTPVGARFITPPDKLNFRTLALRTSLSEFMSQLAWVKPAVYTDNLAAAELARIGYQKQNSDAAYLLKLAQQWRGDFVITQGDIHAHTDQVVFQSGPYRVLRSAPEPERTILP